MRLSVVLLVPVLASCATQNADVRECIRHLPHAQYTVLDSVEFKRKGTLRLIRGQARNEENQTVPDYEFHWPSIPGWGSPQTSSVVLLESKPDKLVLCEIDVRGCSPTLTWLTSDGQAAPHRQWTVTERLEGICVVE